MLKTAETPKRPAILPGGLTVEEHYEPPRWSSCSGTHERYTYRVKYNGRVIIDWFEFEDEAHARSTGVRLVEESTPEELEEIIEEAKR